MNNTILVRYGIDTEDEIMIKWEQVDGGEWLAYHPADTPEESYRLYDLDAVDFVQMMAITQQVMQGDLPAVFLAPRRSEVKFRVQQEA